MTKKPKSKPSFTDEPANFEDDGQRFLVRCPSCGEKNWGPAVASGACAWCGWDANGDDQ